MVLRIQTACRHRPDRRLVNKIKTIVANVHDTSLVPDLLEGTKEKFQRQWISWRRLTRGSAIVQLRKNLDSVQNQYTTFFSEETSGSKTDNSPGSRACQVTQPLQSGACLCRHQRDVPIPEDMIARHAKSRCATVYAVRLGEPDSGRPAFDYGLIRVLLTANT